MHRTCTSIIFTIHDECSTPRQRQVQLYPCVSTPPYAVDCQTRRIVHYIKNSEYRPNGCRLNEIDLKVICKSVRLFEQRTIIMYGTSVYQNKYPNGFIKRMCMIPVSCSFFQIVMLYIYIYMRGTHYCSSCTIVETVRTVLGGYRLVINEISIRLCCAHFGPSKSYLFLWICDLGTEVPSKNKLSSREYYHDCRLHLFSYPLQWYDDREFCSRTVLQVKV